ncbi:U5 snRNP complex subunit AAR2 CYBJADRAFT_51757 [Cyberlindnera jadinii NRRL Y-1542]|uniref:Uncharacterized protein n=1 Tax=Cyberlindnera jadinii (strain ATCC 18201 / CBS 1600 / BCRC 20928 / JCM 3617 / NBRC 0987 / NRRL Y-1542) TaxID=983966 RepID=A0A1E4RV13_CYBJN|nr:hypothetical protein CYBJADRAFT_51757 [Cyberlindnera jadinii NRRL Y-1542]ODV71113.1 hypothetical protein CYBJADRAFT_51757 [Cyberlindnera jadinii NRRL Y-1542]
MSRPLRTTIVMDNIPSDWIIGIDFNFFNSNSILRGIKLIGQGLHVVHWAQDSSSIRSGYYFNAQEGDVLVMYWDTANETMLIGDEVGEVNIKRHMESLSQYYPYMVGYPNGVSQWLRQVRHLKWNQVEYILPHGRIDSVVTSTDENNLLLKTLQSYSKNKNISNDPIVNSIIDQSDVELKFTLIDLSSQIRPNSSPEQKTKDSLDSSWFVRTLLVTGFNNNEDSLMGEFELAYVNMVIFANYSCSVQWLKIMKVMLNCKELVSERVSLFDKFVSQLYAMFEQFPEEYFTEFVDDSFLETNVGEFDFTVKELGLHALVRKVIDLKQLLSLRFGVVIQGLVEDDEDGPVIVDL